ncbi:site-specific integrase [Shewanella submarina]|uniref:Tyrosine-type recombinase/integrase n=1 Tax=Shewanella submarina TaxID=2016376 RepID=A0ABV7GH63_9GAMM|nr:site-specific integrase [Shewanella submarina]MCL1038058.1 site-specific integrase [Shewanella submarina]
MPSVIPLFDGPQYLDQGNAEVNQYITGISIDKVSDAGLVYEHACDWLMEQRHHENNYKAYRSELTTFFHWCFDVAAMSPAQLTRKDISRYVGYCQQPPAELIGYFNVAQFKADKSSGERSPNPAWKPFTGKKTLGQEAPYQLSENALKTKIAILSSFYAYLVGEEYCERNPPQIWMNHSRYNRDRKFALQQDDDLPAFTELQWSYVMACAEKLAREQPRSGERSLFLISLLYACYLRISEVGARAGFSPVMGQFKRHPQTGVWSFHVPQSKGGKRRSVAVSKALLKALSRYRRSLGLTDLPTAGDNTPLFIRHRAAGRGREAGVLNANLGIRQLREEVQQVLEMAALQAREDGLDEDANAMAGMSAHNIRHTGITHDININRRPLSHVQADAGHDSIDTTSKYLHTSQIERHESAYAKVMDNLAGIDGN